MVDAAAFDVDNIAQSPINCPTGHTGQQQQQQEQHKWHKKKKISWKCVRLMRREGKCCNDYHYTIVLPM